MNLPKNILLCMTFALGSLRTYAATTQPIQVKSIDEMTADTQMKGSEKSIEMTKRLRAALMADDQLSTDAHNVKIITLKNAITLKGHVASKAEKIKIENLARANSGTKRVYNRLTY